MTDQALKPCPFCGSATAPRIGPYSVSYVRCLTTIGGCGAHGPERIESHAEAIAAWNNRA